MTDEDLDRLFTYQPPSPGTAVKHSAIREGEAACSAGLLSALQHPAPSFDEITEATRDFARVINRTAPDSADKTAAIRCVRLARMLANEAAAENDRPDLIDDALSALLSARHQACAAVALGG